MAMSYKKLTGKCPKGKSLYIIMTISLQPISAHTAWSLARFIAEHITTQQDWNPNRM